MPNVYVITSFDLIAVAFQSVLAAHHIPVTCLSSLDELDSGRSNPGVLFIEDTILCEGSRTCHQIQQVKKRFPRSKIVIISVTCDPSYVWQLVEAGVNGYLYTQDRLVPRIPLIIEDVSNGGLYLSPSAQTALASIRYYRDLHLTDYQLDVLRLMAEHKTAPQISKILKRTTGAIYQVQKTLREIFNVETNGELVQKILELNLLDENIRS